MNANFKELIGLIEKISRIHTQFRPKREYENKLLTQSLTHLVEQLGKDLGKVIDLDLSGFDPDQIPPKHKTMLKEVLIQLLRNAVSHGVEQPEVRGSAGKPEKGKIQITTSLNGKDFQIEVRDDGRGIDPVILRERAAELNLSLPGKKKSWSAEQWMQMIFMPGFSTAKTADLIAGRGIGMDLVKRKIEQAKGSITVCSEKGKNCVFTVQLPADPVAKN